MKSLIAGIALAASFVATPSSAVQLDSLKGLMGGGGAMTSGSMGNAAGILQYCIANNYLGGDSGASGVKDQLLGKLGAGDTHAATNDANGGAAGTLLKRFGGKSQSTQATTPTRDPGYLDGARGLLRSSDGKTLDLGAAGAGTGGAGDLKAQLTRKVCDAVLKQGKGMIGMGK